jgi:Bacteriocin-protection, YdeI or OmpD-Associated/Domain of unknown function (DUF1905)
MKTSFKTNIRQVGNNTGIEVPAENIAELNAGKKPAVLVDVSGYQYSNTVAVMGGKYMISLSAAHRAASGLKGGDAVSVTLTLETAPRTVEMPSELLEVLAGAMETVFAGLAPAKRKEFVRQVADAKSQETRERRIEKIITQLQYP